MVQKKVPESAGLVGDDLAVLQSSFQTIDQVLPTHGGRDSGRLGSGVRTCLAEAATAADLKGGSGGAKPPEEKV